MAKTISIVTKKFFLDEKKLRLAEERMAGKWLNKGGAFVRVSVRKLLSRRAGVSTPGRPPLLRSGLLRDNILFAGDIKARRVVIGPGFPVRRGNRIGAELLEFGGVTRVNKFSRNVEQRYRAFPYLAPGLEQGLADLRKKFGQGLPEAWRQGTGGMS